MCNTMMGATTPRRNVASAATSTCVLVILVVSCLCPGTFSHRSLKAPDQQQAGSDSSKTSQLNPMPTRLADLVSDQLGMPSSIASSADPAAISVTGTLHTYSVLSLSSSGQRKGSSRYILAADDGRRLNVDLSGVPGLRIGPNAAVDCSEFVVSSNTGSGGTYSGMSCASGTNATLRSSLRKQGGVRVTLRLSQGPAGVRPAAASASAFAAHPLQATGLDLLEQPDAVQGHRSLTAVNRPVSILMAVITACGEPSPGSVANLNNVVLPLYKRWYAAASYGRASLDSHSTAMTVEVDCGIATSCEHAEDDIVKVVKKATRFASSYTNLMVVMPPAWFTACKPDWAGLGQVPGDTTWLANYDIAVKHPDTGLHEMLHNFNLLHANGPTNAEYEDLSCILSGYFPDTGTVFYPNGPHQWQLGWADFVADLDMTKIAAGSTRTVRLPASSSTSTATNLLRVRTNLTSYYVNYRVRAPLDMLPPEFDRKVLVQRLLGDQNTAAPTNYVANLTSGKSITIDGFTLAVASIDGTGASVTVTAGNATKTDPRCGPGVGSCINGACCSSAGFCNVGAAWCGAGCQSLYGECQRSVRIKTGTAANKCVDITENRQVPGQGLVQWDCNRSPAQNFTLVPLGRYWYNIKSTSGLCLSVDGAGGEGSPLILWDCLKADDQSFGFFDTKGRTFNLRPKHNTQVCVDVNEASPDNGAVMQVWECNHTPGQNLTLTA